MIRITSQFDSGAIEVVRAEAPDAIDLNIRRDSHENFRQWFHFRLHGARDTPCTIRFLNAGQCTYPRGWEGYRVAASYDRAEWFRVPTRYADGIMTVSHVPARDSVYYAYFEPYTWERHLLLLGRAEASPRARTVGLGTTVERRDLDVVEVRDANRRSKKQVWVIARQHPGETMAEWFVEGLLARLLDASDPVARDVLARADFHIVPNMNPDGSVRGNLRTNAAGANLNREWLAPSMEKSPEVFLVRERMEASGVDLFIDAHGDEALPYVFVAGSEMLPDFSEDQRTEQTAFVEDFKAASPDFQDRFGYSPDKYSSDALKLASKWVGHRFACLSLTLEMPFKDNADAPDQTAGWNGARSKRLGEAILLPMLANMKRAASGR